MNELRKASQSKYSKSDKGKARLAKYRASLRKDVIEHYGGKCVCCGESILVFLCVDHKNGGGRQQRGKITMAFYKWIKENNYPDDLQVLCWNCNSAKHILGECPHSVICVTHPGTT